MFMLVQEWINKREGTVYEQKVSYYDTKEDLLNAYQYYRSMYSNQVNRNYLILTMGVEYSWAEIDQLF